VVTEIAVNFDVLDLHALNLDLGEVLGPDFCELRNLALLVDYPVKSALSMVPGALHNVVGHRKNVSGSPPTTESRHAWRRPGPLRDALQPALRLITHWQRRSDFSGWTDRSPDIHSDPPSLRRTTRKAHRNSHHAPRPLEVGQRHAWLVEKGTIWSNNAAARLGL
jgi:hypothetical protein